MRAGATSGRFRSGKTKGILAAATLLAAAVFGPAAAGNTDAAWQDSDYAEAALSAATLPVPVVDSCTLTVGGIQSTMVVNWHFPSGTTLQAPVNLDVTVSGGGLLDPVLGVLVPSSLGTTGSGPSYTTTVTVASLSLGSVAYEVSLRSKQGTNWVSSWAVARGTKPALGSATCAPV
ncbi:hypothetical protein [Arthrobacter celericrescens]|uniref:hypothetical protein n=1 Tax=Arthrobacter celericrescens TaxID=2320851 RepID=UPI000EA3D151|nr:hypothetical protein [Arthrobacter celericrescens]